MSMQVYDPFGQAVSSPVIATSTNIYTIEVTTSSGHARICQQL